jgi:hypothetical protein
MDYNQQSQADVFLELLEEGIMGERFKVVDTELLEFIQSYIKPAFENAFKEYK